MGNIHDVITSANSSLIEAHSAVEQNKQEGGAKYLEKNKRGYPTYLVNGRKVVRLGFYVTEEKFEEYYQIAKEVHESGMRAPTGNSKLLPTEPNVNSLLHYSLDFFCSNFRITKGLKPKDIVDLSKMLIKQMPTFMRR